VQEGKNNFVPHWEDLESVDLDFVMQTFDHTQTHTAGDDAIADIIGCEWSGEATGLATTSDDLLFGYLTQK
jgi:hypothetical protein